MAIISYQAHFGLTQAPFGKDTPDAELWLPPSKQDLVDEFQDAVTARESLLLCGEPGVGKTCVLRAVRHRLGSQSFRLTYCHNALVGRRDFYRQLCLAMALPPAATAGALFHTLTAHVQDLRGDRCHPVLLLDEAHLLQQDTLDALHILLNYDWDSAPLLSLVLIGLPELQDRLALRRNRSLFSRLQRRLRIDPLTPEDTAIYLRLRLRRAGCDRDLFTSDAIAMLHEAVAGTMRDLDRLAHAALRDAARKKRRLIERDSIQAILAAPLAA
jgi:type II secretory pathway predicted ATPase ExeA